MPRGPHTFSRFGGSIAPGCGSVNRILVPAPQDAGSVFGRPMRVLVIIVAMLWCGPAFADLRIARDFGGYVDKYKEKYDKVRDRGERVIIDGICNSACTLVLGIV